MADETRSERPRVRSSLDIAERRVEVRLEFLDHKKRVLEEKMSMLLEEEQSDPELREDISTQLTEISSELESLFEQTYSLLHEQERRREILEERQRTVWDRSYELNKHVTTLSVASIAGVAALSRLFPASPALSSAVGTSLVCFAVAIVTGLFAMGADNVKILAVGLGGGAAEQRGNITGAVEWVWNRLDWLFRLACPIAFSWGLIVVVNFLLRGS